MSPESTYRRADGAEHSDGNTYPVLRAGDLVLLPGDIYSELLFHGLYAYTFHVGTKIFFCVDTI